MEGPTEFDSYGAAGRYATACNLQRADPTAPRAEVPESRNWLRSNEILSQAGTQSVPCPCQSCPRENPRLEAMAMQGPSRGSRGWRYLWDGSGGGGEELACYRLRMAADASA